MALTHSKHDTSKNGTRLLKPAIGLKRQKKDEGKHNEKIKCCTNPSNSDSTTYKIHIAYFRDRTPKEWLLFKKKLTLCMTGKNTTDRATKYALARKLLTGRALANFNHAVTLHNNKSIANYTSCFEAVTLGAPPRIPSKIRKGG